MGCVGSRFFGQCGGEFRADGPNRRFEPTGLLWSVGEGVEDRVVPNKRIEPTGL